MSADQGRLKSSPAQKRPPVHRSLSENILHSPETELTEEEAFGRNISVEAEIEVSQILVIPYSF